MNERIIQNKLNSTNCFKYLYFFIGLFTGTNILYFFKIGTTTFNFIYLFSIVLFVCFLLKNKFNIYKIDYNGLLVYFGLCVLSGINVLIINIPGAIDVYCKSICLIPFNIITFYMMSISGENDKYTYKGIMTALVINSMYIIYQTIFARSNMPLLTIPSNFIFGGHVEDVVDVLFYNYRPFGFFKEPSHTAAFYNTMIPLLFYKFNKNSKMLALLVFIIFSYIMTFSSAIPVVFIGIGILMAISFKFNKNIKIDKIIKNLLFGLIIVFILVFIVSSLNSLFNFNFDFIDRLENMMQDTSITSQNNSERFNSMLYAMDILARHPFGTGYGTSATVMKILYGTSRLHSLLLARVSEIGLLYGVFFVGIIISMSKKLLRVNDFKSYCLIVAIVCFMIHISIGGGESYTFIWVVLGLANNYIMQNSGKFLGQYK